MVWLVALIALRRHPSLVVAVAFRFVLQYSKKRFAGTVVIPDIVVIASGVNSGLMLVGYVVALGVTWSRSDSQFDSSAASGRNAAC